MEKCLGKCLANSECSVYISTTIWSWPVEKCTELHEHRDLFIIVFLGPEIVPGTC